MSEDASISLPFLFVVDVWKVDMLAQSLWYADIMADVSRRFEVAAKWSMLNGWY